MHYQDEEERFVSQAYGTLRFTLIATVIAAMPACGTLTASDHAVDPDRAAVERAVRDYLEALYDVEPAKIERSVHPDLVKRGFFLGSDGQYGEDVMTYEDLYLLAGEWNADRDRDIENAPRDVQVLDLLDQTATARLVAHWGIDYMHLARYDGQWKIVQVLWQVHPRGQP